MSDEAASGGGTVLAAGVLAPFLLLATVVVLIGSLGGKAAASAPDDCGAAGTGQTIAHAKLNAEQMDNARIILSVVAGRTLGPRAGVIAETTAWAESSLINSPEETDHDSEGLFQQRVSIYTKAVADDAVKSTNAFLDRLVKVRDWQTISVGDAAQAVQISQPGAPFYTDHLAVGTALVDLLWAAANASAGVGDSAAAPPPMMCTNTAALGSDAVKWLMFFADHGWNVPYENCPTDCRSISGSHSCYRAYTDACRLTHEDCSGFVRWVFWNALHIDIGPDGNTQIRQGLTRHWTVQVTTNIQADWKTMGLQVGDIVFFGVGNGAEVYGNGTVSADPHVGGTSHVAIYAGNGRVVENGGNAWQGYHPLYNQGVYQYVMHPALPGTP